MSKWPHNCEECVFLETEIDHWPNENNPEFTYYYDWYYCPGRHAVGHGIKRHGPAEKDIVVFDIDPTNILHNAIGGGFSFRQLSKKIKTIQTRYDKALKKRDKRG